MPLPFNFKYLPTAKQISLKAVFGDDPDTLIVWLYTHIKKNSKAQSQPIVRVAFRKVSSSGLSDQIVYRNAPIESLGQLRIGSVWKDGFCRSQAVFADAAYEVNFSEGGWRHTSFQQIEDPPYDWESYPLDFRRDKNQFLEFDVSGGGRLVIPCLEFFYRCYGRSAEIKRVLTTYPWHGSNEPHLSRFFAALDEPEEHGKWKVKLRKRLVLDDVLLLAHAKYEPYTERILKDIYGQIESNHDPRYSPEKFLKIQPWHQGKVKLKVKGIRLSNGSFFALQIVGCSDPEGRLIERDKEDQGRNADSGIEGQDVDDLTGGRLRWFTKTSVIVDLTGSEEPDHGWGSTEIIDTDFEVVGQRRAVFDVRRDPEKTGGGRGGSSNGTSPSVVSGGDPFGSGKGVGQASIYAKQVMESHGMLRDMWNAMLYLKRQNPTKIRAVEWVTCESGFSTDLEPILIALTPFKDKDDVDNKTRNWLYFDIESKTPRGVLVARLQVAEKIVFIVEIQRRRRISKEKEEPFKGLVFILDQDQSLKQWLTELLSEIREKVGIVKRLTGKCPGIADTFKHSSSGSDEIACQAAVVNALGKVGINCGKD